jgi:type II secretory pathway pseudopilin PulG
MTASTATKKQAEQAEKQAEQLASAQREVFDASQSQFLAAIKASQKLALDAASAWAGTVNQAYPNQFAPFAKELRANANANIELAAELLEAHKEFTANLLDVLVPVEK